MGLPSLLCLFIEQVSISIIWIVGFRSKFVDWNLNRVEKQRLLWSETWLLLLEIHFFTQARWMISIEVKEPLASITSIQGKWMANDLMISSSNLIWTNRANLWTIIVKGWDALCYYSHTFVTYTKYCIGYRTYYCRNRCPLVSLCDMK